MFKSSGTSEGSSSLCSIIHHLELQNSPGSPWGYTRYPDGKTPAPQRACLLPGPAVHRSIQAVPSLPCCTSELSKINQTPPGASHLLILCSLAVFETNFANTKKKKKKIIFENGRTLKSTSKMTFWGTSQKQSNLLYTVFLLFFSGDMDLYIFTRYDTIWSTLRMLICTSINSYLKDKSKHVCFLFVFFFFSSQLPKGIYEHFGNKDQRRI